MRIIRRQAGKGSIEKKIPAHLPAVLTMGMVSQIGQLLLLRELLMVFHGNELSIGLILSAWLLWVGIGSRLGSWVAVRFRDIRKTLLITVIGAAAALPASLAGVRALRMLFGLIPGTRFSLLDMTLACFTIMAPVCLLLGAQFVLLSRIWRESEGGTDTAGAAKTYVGEAVGNMLGGLVFTFLMVRNLNTFTSAFLISAIMPAAFLALKEDKKATSGNRLRAMLVVIGFSAMLLLAADNLEGWTNRLHWRTFSPRHDLIDTHPSPHGAISVLQHEEQVSFFQSGNLVFSTAGPQAADVGLENQDAVLFAHFAMVQHADPQQVLLIGGGLRGTLTEIAKHPLEHITYVELDEALTEAAAPYSPAETLASLQDPRVNLVHGDGRLYVKSSRSAYDVIIVDVPDPATAVLNRFYTREFFSEAAALLRPDGVLVIGTTSTPNLRDLAMLNRNATIYHTLADVFSKVFAAGEQNLIYFAANAEGQISLDAAVLQARYLTRDIRSDDFSPQFFHTMLQETTLRRVNWALRQHGRTPDAHLQSAAAPPLLIPDLADLHQLETDLPAVNPRFFINSDLKPIGYFYTLMVLEELTRAGQRQFLQNLLQVRLWWAALIFGLPTLAVAIIRAAAGRTHQDSATHLAVLFSVFTTGFSTMVLQVALIFSFQSIYGFVYEIIGLIAALFMFGLALGAFFTNRFIKDKGNVTTLATLELLIAALAGVIALVLPAAAALRSPLVIFALFCTLTFFGGIINGVCFPLSTACCQRVVRQAEKSTGTVYSLELMGACIGAGLASMALAPVLGITACCLIAGLANAAAGIALFFSRRV